MAGNAETLATFEDRSGRAHKVVLMAGRLLLDLIDRHPPLVLALLGPGEGIEHAKAIVLGSETDEGYAERAKREGAPLCRPLEPDDLRPGEPELAGDSDDWPVAA